MTPETHEEQSHPAWWKPRNWPRAVWVLVIGGILLMVPFCIRTLILSAVPAMEEPFDVAEFVRWDVPADQDAFTEYRAAAEICRHIETSLPLEHDLHIVQTNVVEKGWAEATEPLKQWLELYREALAVWRRGTARQFALGVSPTKRPFLADHGWLSEIRSVAQMAVLEEIRCLHEGKLQEAWEWVRAIHRSGGHTSHRGEILQVLTSCAIHGISMEEAIRWAEHRMVTSDQLKTSLADVKSDFNLYQSHSNLLKSIYLEQQNVLRSREWLAYCSIPYNIDQHVHGADFVMKMGLWFLGEPELSERNARQVLANQLREIDKPLALRRKRVGTGPAMLFESDPTVPKLPGQLDAAGIDRGTNLSYVSRQLFMFTVSCDDALLSQAARQAAIEVVLAAQAYQRDCGEFPEALSLLVPDYLNAVPLDPCDPTGGPLRYRRDDLLNAVVWSVGYDHADGGGEIANANRSAADMGFALRVVQ